MALAQSGSPASLSRQVSFGQVLGYALRGIGAVVLLIACQILFSSLFGMSASSKSNASAPTAESGKALLGLFGMAVFYVIALSYVVVRSRWSGLKLVGATFLAFAGISTLMLQSESLVYLIFLVPIIPADVLPGLLIAGALTAATFTPLLVLVWGKMRRQVEIDAGFEWPAKSLTGWLWRFALIGIIYNVIYFFFGNFVAVPLAGPAFNEYYKDLVVPIWMPLFQFGRGIVWAALLLPVLRMTRGSWWQAGLAVALLSSFLTASPLLVTNPYMPDAMRFAHFFELLTSNFVFGWAVAYLFRRQ